MNIVRIYFQLCLWAERYIICIYVNQGLISHRFSQISALLKFHIIYHNSNPQSLSYESSAARILIVLLKVHGK